MTPCDYLADLAVQHRNRRMGVGAALISAYLSSLIHSGLDAVVVRTNEDDPERHAFYAKTGFTKLPVTALQHQGVLKRYFYYSFVERVPSTSAREPRGD